MRDLVAMLVSSGESSERTDASMEFIGAGGDKPAGVRNVVLALGGTQTIAWASSYYLPAILAAPIARDLGVTTTLVFGALSGALIISGVLGPVVGRTIDAVGGRGVLVASNVAFAAGLFILSRANGLVGLLLAWSVIGVGMAFELYEAAFAALTRLYGAAARQPITGITLIAGFASTIGWPLSSWLDASFGWRAVCQVWALVHLAIALPLNLALPRAALVAHGDTVANGGAADSGPETVTMTIIAYVFAATGFVGAGLSAALPTLLVQFGATPAAALLAGTLVGPSQVAARIAEATWLSHYHPLVSARLATLTMPLGVIALVGGGPFLAPLFAILYGAGNSVLTIARGTLPLAMFGPQGFGRRVGILSLPARVTGALAPLATGVIAERLGIGLLWVCALISLSAFAALLVLRPPPPAD